MRRKMRSCVFPQAFEEGRLVTLVPPQSYLDSSTSEFSLSVVNPARCWHPEFRYAGRSVYAALLAYAPPDTYDLVSLQLYESWSLAACGAPYPHPAGAAPRTGPHQPDRCSRDSLASEPRSHSPQLSFEHLALISPRVAC